MLNSVTQYLRVLNRARGSNFMLCSLVLYKHESIDERLRYNADIVLTLLPYKVKILF